MMKHYDCNAFTMPCFEVCATRELDKRKLTFCLAHSLFKDEELHLHVQETWEAF